MPVFERPGDMFGPVTRTNMTTEKKELKLDENRTRIRLAEAIGWTSLCMDGMSGEPIGKFPSVYDTFEYLPLFTLDLMHEAEKSFTKSGQRVEYVNKLFRICGSWEACAFATKGQRANAFIETMNNWNPRHEPKH